MTDVRLLRQLLERVRTGAGLDRTLDTEICTTLFPEAGPCEPHCAGDEPMFHHEPLRKRQPPRLTLRLDSALWLLRQLLPGHDWKIESPSYYIESGNTAEYYAVVRDTARSREALSELRSPQPNDHITRRGVHAQTHFGTTAQSEARALLAAVLHTLVVKESRNV